MEMKWSVSHMNAKGQCHFRAVFPEPATMGIYTNVVSNISATSLVQVSSERGPLVLFLFRLSVINNSANLLLRKLVRAIFYIII